MSFLKNYYEKIILAFLLVLFVALLVYQISILMEASKQSVDSITGRREPNPDHRKTDFQAPEYNYEGIFSRNANWQTITKRSERSVYFTDILAPYPMAECPVCLQLIPQSVFPAIGSEKTGVCPICRAPLTAARAEVQVVDNDTNRNGIPDALEVKLGLALDDPEAIRRDLDGDGFSVEEEFKAKTDFRNPKSHPSYATKLFVKKIERKKIPMRVKKVLYRGNNDSKKWEIQMDVRDDKFRTRTIWPKIGETINVAYDEKNHISFKILEVLKDIRDVFDPKLGAKLPKDFSRIVFQRADSPDKITAELDKDIFEPRESIQFFNVIAKSELSGTLGGTIELGSKRTGIERFTIESSDPNTNTVRLKGADNKLYVIPQYVETPFVPAEGEGASILPPERAPKMPAGLRPISVK